MQQELRGLDLEVLDSMHREAHAYLHACLRRGADNAEISAQRQILSELSYAIDSKLRSYFSCPSDTPYSRRATAPPLLHC